MLGDKRGIEHRNPQVGSMSLPFYHTGKLRRYFSWQNMLDIFKVGWGVRRSLSCYEFVHNAFQGSFVSVPPVIACVRAPVFIHESDLS